jgi:quinol monooxygenase YgiN
MTNTETIIRIVRMTFQVDKTQEFLSIFEATKAKIRHFEGCSFLELWQDAENPAVFMTHSHWVSIAALENYRQSDLFQTTWAKTKVLFAAKPLAFSSVKVADLPKSIHN